jgi:hypothetical protein
MKLVPASRRARRRSLPLVTRAIRLVALVRALAVAAGRRRGAWLALRGSPLGLALAAAGLALAAVRRRRRRRRRRLEADLGPPNESAPGHRVGPATDAPGAPADVPDGPNQGAPGDEPAPEPAKRPS